MSIFGYIYFRILKKIQYKAILRSRVDKNAKVEAGSVICDSSIGRFSFCGYNCTIINASIGSFCSIAANVTIGNATHPLSWVSTSPAFYKGRDSISKRLAILEYQESRLPYRTAIGNDVWIGDHVLIKAGVKIGDGAVVGMGSIVTKDVAPYCIVAGNPAKLIRKRFAEDIIEKLISMQWWSWGEAKLSENSLYFNDINLFLEKNKI